MCLSFFSFAERNQAVFFRSPIPHKRPATLISSSISSQWIPVPPPLNSNCARCSGVACKSLGKYAKGTDNCLPSVSSNQRFSESVQTFLSLTLSIHGDCSDCILVIIILPPPGYKTLEWQRSVGRASVDDDVFDVGISLAPDAFEAGSDVACVVENSSDNRNSHLSPNMSRVWEVRGHLVGFRRYFMKAVRSRLVSPAKE